MCVCVCVYVCVCIMLTVAFDKCSLELKFYSLFISCHFICNIIIIISTTGSKEGVQ